MAMTQRRDVQPPNGSLIIWMAGLVLGAGAAIVLVYHLLLASHSVATQKLHAARMMAAHVATAPAPDAGALTAEHAEAMRAAMKRHG